MISALVIILLTLTALGFQKFTWWMPILDFFRLQYAGAAALLFFLSLYTFNLPGIFLCPFIIYINLFRIRHFLPFFTSDKPSSKRQIMSINSYKENGEKGKLKRLIDDATPDVLLIMEMTEDHRQALGITLELYPYHLEHPVRDGFSIALYSRSEMTSADITFHGPGDTPLLHATIIIDDQYYSVFSAHPKPALNEVWAQERTTYFEEIIPIIQNAPYPVIILGDFNSVPWEDHFEGFLNETNLRSTLYDHGYKITWPTKYLFAGIPMDHILLSPTIDYKNLNVGPYVGSDHYPISINLK